MTQPPAPPLARTVIPSLNILPPDTPTALFPTTLAHFKSIPWTAALLSQPNTVPFIMQCRNNSGSPTEDQLFGSTLLSDRAIPHMLSFFTASESVAANPSRPVDSVSTLFELGEGLTGGPSILHGGMTMAMVDEAMGALTEVNCALGKESEAFAGLSVTGSLEIKFRQPILTRNTIIVTAWIESVQRRKTRVRCEVKDEGDVVLAECASVWVAPRSKM